MNAQVADHVTRRRSLIGLFKSRASSSEGNIQTILPTSILPSRTSHHGIRHNHLCYIVHLAALLLGPHCFAYNPFYPTTVGIFGWR